MSSQRTAKRSFCAAALHARSALGAAVAALAAASPAQAALIQPDTTADGYALGGSCTLREAVISASTDSGDLGCEAGSGDDAIVLGAGIYELTLSGGGPDETQGDLLVNDPDGDLLQIVSFSRATIDASAVADRVIAASSPLTLIGVAITGGDASQALEEPGLGGAVTTFGPSPPQLTLLSVSVWGNTADLRGGGIHSAGGLTLINATISGNTLASGSGGGGGGVSSVGDVAITRSTIAANSAAADSDDSADGGGLLYDAGLRLEGSILADNSADGGGEQCFGGAAGSEGFNVIESLADCGLTTVAGDVIADAGLLALADNGGSTLTHAFDGGAPPHQIGPAQGAAACSEGSDQRGAPRGREDSGPCDAGAYELNFCSLTPANVIGSPSADLLGGFEGPYSILALGGDDVLVGGPGDDALCGGEGVDTLIGGFGADILNGGAGTDIASYENAAAAVTVTLDGVANDGPIGEGDNALVESVAGGSAADRLTGNEQANGFTGGTGADILLGLAGADSLVGQGGGDELRGGGGADVIRGGGERDLIFGDGQADSIRGDDGNDTIRGGPGADHLRGGDSKDKLFGNAGSDQIDGGEGGDRLRGGPGNDRLAGGPGKDEFRCGGGRDTVIAARGERVARDCEKVKRRG